jgi:hypothetical protein
MIIVSGVNSKKVNDPVFLSARKFMEERLRKLEAQGPSAELELEKERYTGLTAKDVMIEPPVTFDSGTVLCCFLSRKTGFFRADIEVEKVDVRLIFAEFSVAITEYELLDDLVAAVKNDLQKEGVVFVKSTGKYGIVCAKLKGTPEAIMKIMGDIYWHQIDTSVSNQIDPVTKESGTFEIKTINIEDTSGSLFFIEDLKALT